MIQITFYIIIVGIVLILVIIHIIENTEYWNIFNYISKIIILII